VQKGKELNDLQRNPLDIEILSNLRFCSLEIRFGVPEASSELTSLVCRVQEKFTEEVIHSIHSNSVTKATRTDQEADFATERKKTQERE
jgi:ribosomal protein L12E/L44/L45/RPP1/RPP2